MKRFIRVLGGSLFIGLLMLLIASVPVSAHSTRNNFLPKGQGVVGGAVAKPDVVLEIFDKRLKRVVSGNQTKIVGQRIELEVLSKPKEQLMNIQWTMPGQTVAKYTENQKEGTAMPLTAQDLTQKDVNFYWIAGTDQKGLSVQVSATVNGKKLGPESVTYIVLAPTFGMDPMTSRTSRVSVFNLPLNVRPYTGFGRLVYATKDNDGIVWTFTATAPNDGMGNGGGQIAATQLINSLRTSTLNPNPPLKNCNQGTVKTATSRGDFVLDTKVLYPRPNEPGPIPIAAGQAATWTSIDSPLNELSPDICKSTAEDSFRIFFMYRPTGNGTDSIWVTLGRLDWYWKADATRNLMTNEWTLADAKRNMDPTGNPSTELPQWKKNVKDIESNYILLKPPSGPVNTNVMVTGFGFDPNEVVQISFNGNNIVNVTADPDGEITGQFTVPQGTKPDTYPVQAVGEKSKLMPKAFFVVTG